MPETGATFTLTDLQVGGVTTRRIVHGYATSGTWSRLVYRGLTVLREMTRALPRDVVQWVGRRRNRLLRVEPGLDPWPEASSVALYVHYAPDGRISDMVRAQVGGLRDAGFAVVFVTSCVVVPEADWQSIRGRAALVVRRRNFGLDFGAWQDVVPLVRQRWPALRELLLANDSVLGPVHPMTPVLHAMRTGGDGLFGLTESLQGGAHLQSYMLLARGSGAAADVLRFLERLFVSHSKWLLVQMSELRLARWMLRRGHRVAAVFGYARVIEAAVAEPDERRRLAASHARLGGLARMPDEAAHTALMDWPLNPTQHLWHVLVTRLQCPFIKTELVRRNPGQLPDVASWPAVVPADAPCPLPVLQAHLAAMGPG